jgi:hypothetical protein
MRLFLKITVVILMFNFSLPLFPGFSSSVVFDPFEKLIGVSEQQFFNKYGFSEAGKKFLRERLQNKQGEFYVKKVEPFQYAYCGKIDKGGVRFSIVEGGENPVGKSFEKNVDVAALQALPENNGAVFQVASNLSCLESTGTKQERISNYFGVRAQGSRCALSALPGIIDRMYLQPPINLLAHFDCNGPIPYTSGTFPYVPDLGFRIRFEHMNLDDIYRAAETMSVGVQKNVCITSGLWDFSNGEFRAVSVEGTDQRITQVFTAAVDPYNNAPADIIRIGFKNLAYTLLYGAYKGTFDVVREVGAKKLFLTMVGGGFFKNDYFWITQAITTACCDFSENKKNTDEPLQVTLVLYYISPVDKQKEGWEGWKNAERWLQHLVFKTGGTWTRYTSSGVSLVPCRPITVRGHEL